MARYNPSLVHKVVGEVTPAVEAAIMKITSISACAGIKDNPDAAFRARVNHHGAPATHVPARRFVYDATLNIGDIKFGAEIRRVIKEQLRDPKAAVNSFDPNAYSGRGEFSGVTEYGKRVHERAQPFGEVGGDHVQHSARQIMQRLANQMLANQKRAVAARAYKSHANNGNNPAINQPSVVHRKGFDYPMVDTGVTLSALEAWTE